MYFYLVQSLKRRLILELRDSFSQHPVYDKIVPHIQNKHVFKERPQFGIVVKGSSANKVALSADNFLGTIFSHVMLSYVGQPAYPLEWVREDLEQVRRNNDVMPTPPGVYYMEILHAPENAQSFGQFMIDPLLTVSDEPVLQFQSGVETEAQLQYVPVAGTLRLYENRRFLLVEGEHYQIEGKQIRLLARFIPGAVLTADYRYAVESIGPVNFTWNTADVNTLPGVVMAFGKRAREGDKVAVVVYPSRVEAAQAFGGRFDATFEFDVIARDPIQMEEVADLVVMYLWGQKRPRLSEEGLEITDISMGGETEESFDETADEYYYNASMSVQIQADWEIHVPLPLTISQVTATTKDASASTIVGDVSSRLFFATVPTLAGKNHNFERIR